MKKLLLILLCSPVFLFGQRIVVDTDGGRLNLRSGPSIEFKIVDKIDDGTYLNYSNDFVPYGDGSDTMGWIKVNCPIVNPEGLGCDATGVLEGWVSVNYINAPNFKSKILKPINWKNRYPACEIPSCGKSIYTAQGTLIKYCDYEDSIMLINMNGVETTLQIKKDEFDNFSTYSNNDITIKLFLVPSRTWHLGRSYSGFMIIYYNNIEEIIFVKTTEGC